MMAYEKKLDEGTIMRILHRVCEHDCGIQVRQATTTEDIKDQREMSQQVVRIYIIGWAVIRRAKLPR